MLYFTAMLMHMCFLTSLWCCCFSLQSFWKIDGDYKNVITYDFQIEIIQTVSVIQCTEKCFYDEQCQSFFYTHGVGSCLLNTQKINETVVTQNSSNTQLYYLIGEEMSHDVTCLGFEYLPLLGKSLKTLSHRSGNWTTAYRNCQENGGKLAILKTDEALDAAMKFVNRQFGTAADASGFWVSARYYDDIGDFVWTDDNSPVLSSQWHPGEPKGLHVVPFVNQCVIMVPNNNKLNNDKCDLSFKSIHPLCECT